jgi:hypothetical protein
MCGAGGPGGFNVHGCGIFFLWHRWFLFFHERALAAACGSSGQMALPFWLEPLSTPLTIFDELRTPALGWDASKWPQPAPSKDDGGTCDMGNVEGQLNLEGNLGSSLGTVAGSASLMQVLYWHGHIHNVLGSQQQGRPYLGDIMLSAVDPLFYFLHSTVDRLFEYWTTAPCRANPGGPCVKNMNMGTISDQTFTFWDATTQEWVKVCASDAFRLNYNYDPLPSPPDGLRRKFRTVLTLEQVPLVVPPDGTRILAAPRGERPAFVGTIRSRFASHLHHGSEEVSASLVVPGNHDVRRNDWVVYAQAGKSKRVEISGSQFKVASLPETPLNFL